MRRVGALTTAAGILAAVFAFGAAWAEHGQRSIAMFLFGWTAFPSLCAAMLCLTAARRSWSPAWRFGIAVSSLALGLASLTLEIRSYFRGPPNPNTAAHMAPLLLPPILLIAGVIVFLAATAFVAVARRLGASAGVHRAA